MITRALRESEQAEQVVPLDPELSDLANISLGEQPDLRNVAAGVIAAVSTRTEAWYCQKYPGRKTEQESDASVRDLVNAIFFNADQTATVFR